MCEPLHLVTIQRPVDAQRGTSLSMHYVYRFSSLSYCGLKHSVLISFSTNPIVHILFFYFQHEKKKLPEAPVYKFKFGLLPLGDNAQYSALVSLRYKTEK